MFFEGVLDRMDMHQLAVTFTSLVHEERKRDNPSPGGRHVLRGLRHRIDQAIHRFMALEKKAGFRDTIKPANFATSAAADAWSRGASIDKVERLAGQAGGDVVRTMRMAVQMMRQLRQAIGRDYPLSDRLAEAEVSLNRDVVDAKRQFELG